jgi:hypothetical protein
MYPAHVANAHCMDVLLLPFLQVVERAAGDAWASEFGASSSAAAAASNWSSEFMQQQGQQQQQPAPPRDWAAEFADGFANINIGDGATEEQLEAAWAEMGEWCRLRQLSGSMLLLFTCVIRQGAGEDATGQAGCCGGTQQHVVIPHVLAEEGACSMTQPRC